MIGRGEHRLVLRLRGASAVEPHCVVEQRGLVLGALQEVTLAYLRRAGSAIPFWAMASTPVAELQARAEAVVAQLGGRVRAEAMEALPGAGSLPGVTMPSYGLALDGDHAEVLRARRPPIVGRVRDGRTFLDLRTVDPADDQTLAAALATLG